MELQIAIGAGIIATAIYLSLAAFLHRMQIQTWLNSGKKEK